MIEKSLYEHYEGLPLNWSFLLRAVTKWRKSSRFCYLMLGISGLSCLVGYVWLAGLALILALGGYFVAKKAKADIVLGKPYLLKNIRALSSAIEHQQLSDDFRTALIERVSDYERRFLSLKI